jgi:hypothetical protein
MNTVVIIQLFSFDGCQTIAKLGSNKVIKLEFGFSRLLSLKLETSVNLFYGNLNISLASYYSK